MQLERAPTRWPHSERVSFVKDHLNRPSSTGARPAKFVLEHQRLQDVEGCLGSCLEVLGGEWSVESVCYKVTLKVRVRLDAKRQQ